MGDMEEGTLDKSPSIVSAHPVVFPEHHVKFREGQDNFENHNLINLQKLSPFKLQAHLGFLKLNHTYEIVIDLKVPEYIEHTQWIVSDSSASAFGKITSFEASGDKGTLHIELKANKAKLLTDIVKLTSGFDPSKHLEVNLMARVLGKGQGTPMLKDGIHCIAVQADDESEASDWQGFE